MKIDKALKLSCLMEIYGHFITTRKKQIVDTYINEDITLAEIGEQFGISRQAVLDAINVTEKKLDILERKLGLLKIKKTLSYILDNESLTRSEILDRLQDLLEGK